MVFPKAVRASEASRMPAIIFRASGLSLPSSTSRFLPSFSTSMWKCIPLPALPTVIFGAKLISTPYWLPSIRKTHFATINCSTACSTGIGRNSISCCS